MDAQAQSEVDKALHELDGTETFSQIGGNTAYALSLATAFAAALSKGIPAFEHLRGSREPNLPVPLGNVIGGGMHASGHRADIQEFLLLPIGARSIAQAAEANIKVHSQIGKLLSRSTATPLGRGDEGAWVANLTTEDVLQTIANACDIVSGEMGVNIRMGVDIAASTLWNEDEKAYIYQRDGRRLSEADQLEFIVGLVDSYGLAYIEDPFHEDDFESFAKLRKRLSNTLICGDDLIVTNLKRLQIASKLGAVNAVIIKPNQVGTVSDARKTTEEALKLNYVPVISHRSGDVCGGELAHLSVGLGCPIIKCGIIGGERVSKVNELIRIEEKLGELAKMARLEL
jgi:enolase